MGTKLSQALQGYGIQTLWHVTHLANLASIMEYGILSREEIHRKNLQFEDISDPSVQRLRTGYHNYVPLFLVLSTPMLYVCWQRHSEAVAAIEVNIQVADFKGVQFSDGNIAASKTNIYSDPKNLQNLDWEVIRAPWGAYSQEWKRKRSAEILVPQFVPREYVNRIHLNSREEWWQGDNAKKWKLELQMIGFKLHPKFSLRDDFMKEYFKFDLTENGLGLKVSRRSYFKGYIVIDVTKKS